MRVDLPVNAGCDPPALSKEEVCPQKDAAVVEAGALVLFAVPLPDRLVLPGELSGEPGRSDGQRRTERPPYGRRGPEPVAVLVQRDPGIDGDAEANPPERPRPLSRQRRIEGAAAELDVLVFQAAPAEVDRIGLGVPERESDPGAEDPVASAREGDVDLTIADSVEPLGSVVNIAVRRGERLPVECAVRDVLILDVIRETCGNEKVLAPAVSDREIGVEQVQSCEMKVVGNGRRCALGRNIGTRRDVGGAESAVRRREADAPRAARKKLELGLSAGEIGVGSGGSGVGGRRDCERQEQEREHRGRANSRRHEDCARAFSRTFRNWSQLPPVTSSTNFPRAS